jgi:hypothetical protein
MRPDPLPTLLRLRQMEMDAARAELLPAEAQLADAGRAVQAAEQAIRREMAAASMVDCDDATVEAFAKWLPTGRASVARAKALRTRAEDSTLQARTMFNLARTAYEAVEKLIAEKRNLVLRASERHEQAGLDEVASQILRRRRG